MDVGSLFVWISVGMVLIVRRCAITSRWGHLSHTPMEAFCPHTPMEAFCPHTPFHGRGSECFTNTPLQGHLKPATGHLKPATGAPKARNRGT